MVVMIRLLPIFLLVLFILGLGYLGNDYLIQRTQIKQLLGEKSDLDSKLASSSSGLKTLQNQDQVKINADLTAEIKNIHDTYSFASSVYELLVTARDKGIKTATFDKLFASSLSNLSNRKYSTASAELSDLKNKVQSEIDKTNIPTAAVVASAPASNTAPDSGYSRQMVNTDAGSFLVDLVAGDMGSTRVIVDTASDSDCGNSCPVLDLGSYVSRSGAYAGVNGTYFCPEAYPSCAGKTNSFDLLVMNKNKKYFNSDNNVYSTNPVAVFQGGSIRFVGRGSDWGRDTGVDGVIMNYPLLVSGSNVVVGSTGDSKQDSKGNRSFVAAKGNTAYIGVVHNVTMFESAKTLAALGMDGALNLDDGGSTALWSGGYKVGPGRSLPNAVLFVRK